MVKRIRPRRSVLYMPGANARALEKGRSLPADGLIMDLEDSVAPEAKQKAMEQIHAAVAAGGYGRRELVVRVNGIYTAWGYNDIVTVSNFGIDAILLPKVESAGTVHQVESIMEAAGAPDDLSIWCMMETPLGMLHAEEIAHASPRVGCLVLGTSDLAKDLHAAHTRDRLPFLASLELCVLAARAAGISVLDGVHLDLDDDAGFAAACRQGRELGFDGKTLIHPKTIAMANQTFAPTADEVAWSRRIIAAHAEASKEGKGIVVVDGTLVENLHVMNAERLVALAEVIESMEAAGAE